MSLNETIHCPFADHASRRGQFLVLIGSSRTTLAAATSHTRIFLEAPAASSWPSGDSATPPRQGVIQPIDEAVIIVVLPSRASAPAGSGGSSFSAGSVAADRDGHVTTSASTNAA